MNLGKLRELIEGKPDSMEILIPFPDTWADYVEANRHISGEFRIATAVKQEKPGLWAEDGEETTPGAEYGKRETVLIVD